MAKNSDSMSLSQTIQRGHQERLKHELQSERDARKLEHLAAALLGRLLDVPIAVASSGFQHGADAGSVGRRGRRFRLECKKYSDTRSLSERELLGEIEQALARDEALEGWFLIATRPVPEQIRQSLVQHGEQQGVPIEIIDWGENHDTPPLAALCALDPELVEEFFSVQAGKEARALQSISDDAIERLRRDLQSWCLGFASFRTRSFKKLDSIWNDARTSNAELGQDAAGGAREKKVRRSGVHEALNAWWQGLASEDAPAVVVGEEGAGKTWATLDWLIDSKKDQPIVLLIPSSAAAEFRNDITVTGVKKLLARRFYELTEVRDPEHWFHRVNYLLKRPEDEGPALTVFIDGLNQEPSVEWVKLVKILQDQTFSKRVRVILSTRNLHFSERLSNLRGLIVPSEPVEVGLFDRAPGGELDQMLEFEGLVQTDLHGDVIEWACKPRLFKIVVRLRENLVGSGQITINRILWEYGRDTFGERHERSFSSDEWENWLKEIAEEHRGTMPTYSLKGIVETVDRPDLDSNHVYARLSDIVDGRFFTRNDSGDFVLNSAVVSHALGVALLNEFRRVTSPSFETLKATLSTWLDPIESFDERAEILRAAVSILVAQERAAESPIPGVLVTAWLQSQNFPEKHLKELAALAPSFPNALLDAVEHSGDHNYNAARLRSVDALRAIPRTDRTTLTEIVQRTQRWLRTVPADVAGDGTYTVLGVELEPVGRSLESLKTTVPSIIEGFPLTETLPIFEAEAVVAIHIGRPSECWEGLRWLCLFNEIDPDEMTAALRNLSEEVSGRQPESGVNPDLPQRVAVRLLRLTGRREDEDTAASHSATISRRLTYEKDYLLRPGRSIFPLERQHTESVLKDSELTLVSRVQRTKELWFDPTFAPPESFVEELRAAAACIDVEKLDRQQIPTIEDYVLRELEPALARCVPNGLADLIRRKVKSIATCPPGSRYWSAISATDHLILAGEAEVEAARVSRLSGRDIEEEKKDHATSRLLLMEVLHLDAQAQVDTIVQADLKCIESDFSTVLRPLTPDDIDALIDCYRPGSKKQHTHLLTLLSCNPQGLSDKAWSWVEGFAKHKCSIHRGKAFRILAQTDSARFGQILASDNWSWDPDESFLINDCGTSALFEATADLSFNDIAHRLAPWRLPWAARHRGPDPTDVWLAANTFGQWFLGVGLWSSPPLIAIDAEDLEPILWYAPDIVELWLEGCSELKEGFINRAHNSFFLPLCEALLAHDPSRGVQLWRALHDIVPFQSIGAANVVELWHIAFRAPDSQTVTELREELAGLKYCHTDQALSDLAISATYNGKADWLAERIATDQASLLSWKQQRAVVLEGFTSNNSLPVEDAWPDGEIQTNYADCAQTSARYRWIEACARHWWRMYLKAPNPTQAYAAWVLFLRSADKRAWVWMQQDIENANGPEDFLKRKMLHFHLNQENLNSDLKKRAGKIDRSFLYGKVHKGVGPWA